MLANLVVEKDETQFILLKMILIRKHMIYQNFHEGKEYMKYLGNEEIGDPEYLE